MTKTGIINKLEDKIFNIGIDETQGIIEKEKNKLINIYIFFITITIPLLILAFLIWTPGYNFFFNVIGFMILFGSYFMFTNLRFNNFVKLLYILANIFEIFFNSSFYGAGIILELYFIPYLLATSFLFDFKKDVYYVALIFSLVFFLIIVNQITDFRLFYNKRYTADFHENLGDITSIYSLLFIILNIYFINRKDNIIKTNIDANNPLQKESVNVDQLQDFISKSKKSNNGFMTEFNYFFPDFIKKLLAINPKLIASELEVCAMLKLNFSTKEMAVSTNSTIAAINRKKNRLRKKLNISSTEDLNIWIIKL
ncbi:helix-turn-helix transcriptional regulator [Chryseobacterium viscerum]|uniref:HTH luxR-type domain-containing protein n=1 Tax=Chryseobacterium viscerum TaxID=1037377 RepID=A0A5N4BL90_9FLAO|nr:hypothetical protein [Chryseobacterium viscerum]KAB1229199.1 hypothetical protein F8D52_18305 [Chryseobacterium viscerum]